MTLANLSFHFPAGDAWEARLQVTYIAPAEPPDPNLPAGLDEEQPPRMNIVVSRVPAQRASPAADYQEFITQTARAVSGLEEIESLAPLQFADGALGVVALIRFPVTPQIALMQLHAFRIDDGVSTQLVATITDSEPPHRREELRAMLKGFTP